MNCEEMDKRRWANGVWLGLIMMVLATLLGMVMQWGICHWAIYCRVPIPIAAPMPTPTPGAFKGFMPGVLETFRAMPTPTAGSTETPSPRDGNPWTGCTKAYGCPNHS
jgi:hypothetical protein